MDDTAHPESQERPLRAQDVYDSLGGAALLGVCLAGLVQYLSGQPSTAVAVLPPWLWLLGSVFLLSAAVRAKSMAARMTDGAFALSLLAFAAMQWLPHLELLRLGHWLCLAAWAGMLWQQSHAHIPRSLGRAAWALGIATTAMGLLPGPWKWPPLAAAVLIVAVSAWMLDDLDARGALLRKRD